ncbi:MAG TPA: hypothetical protein VF980_08550 [Thermoanaerobaculia bacterium]
MKVRLAVYLVVVVVVVGSAVAQSTGNSPTGTFTLQDPTQFFGVTQTPGNALNSANANFLATVAGGTPALPTTLSLEAIGFTPQNGEDWIFNFAVAGTNAGIKPGAFVIDDINATAGLTLVGFGSCSATGGTVTITALTTDTTGSVQTTQGAFNLVCTATTTVIGTFSFAAPATTGGGGGGGGGSTRGGGGTASGGIGRIPGLGRLPVGTPVTPTNPTPATPLMLLSTTTPEVSLTTGDTAKARLTTAMFNAQGDVSFTASASRGLTFSFDPATIASPGTGVTTMTIGTTNGITTGDSRITVTGRSGAVRASMSILVHVFCDSPMILGVDQPRGTVINPGQAVQLEVNPSGSGPFTFQWFLGHRGSTAFPIDGATDSRLATPTLTQTTEFWVRVSNPCGSVDSETATVIVRR